MKLGVYAVYDAAVGAYLNPFYARARGEALRSFSQACNDEKHQFALHARDYMLFELGTFDDSNGSFETPAVPVRVIDAVSCRVDAVEEQQLHGPGERLRKIM